MYPQIGYSCSLLEFSLEIFALFMLTGVFSTLLIPETKQKTLEELSNEDQEGFVRSSSTFPYLHYFRV